MSHLFPSLWCLPCLPWRCQRNWIARTPQGGGLPLWAPAQWVQRMPRGQTGDRQMNRGPGCLNELGDRSQSRGQATPGEVGRGRCHTRKNQHSKLN